MKLREKGEVARHLAVIDLIFMREKSLYSTSVCELCTGEILPVPDQLVVVTSLGYTDGRSGDVTFW